jgi:alkylation response protein AidB-like acyl-CoA dehydrogenase
MARTDTPDARRAQGNLTFILTPDLPGFAMGKKEDKMGLRASPTVQLVLDGCACRPTACSARKGWVHLRHAVARHGRLGIAAQAIGIARAALKHSTVAYATERKQFGKPIAISRRFSSSSPTWPRA